MFQRSPHPSDDTVRRGSGPFDPFLVAASREHGVASARPYRLRLLASYEARLSRQSEAELDQTGVYLANGLPGGWAGLPTVAALHEELDALADRTAGEFDLSGRTEEDARRLRHALKETIRPASLVGQASWYEALAGDSATRRVLRRLCEDARVICKRRHVAFVQKLEERLGEPRLMSVGLRMLFGEVHQLPEVWDGYADGEAQRWLDFVLTRRDWTELPLENRLRVIAALDYTELVRGMPPPASLGDLIDREDAAVMGHPPKTRDVLRTAIVELFMEGSRITQDVLVTRAAKLSGVRSKEKMKSKKAGLRSSLRAWPLFDGVATDDADAFHRIAAELATEEYSGVSLDPLR